MQRRDIFTIRDLWSELEDPFLFIRIKSPALEGIFDGVAIEATVNERLHVHL
jgi:hypothetical protein